MCDRNDRWIRRIQEGNTRIIEYNIRLENMRVTPDFPRIAYLIQWKSARNMVQNARKIYGRDSWQDFISGIRIIDRHMHLVPLLSECMRQVSDRIFCPTQGMKWIFSSDDKNTHDIK